MATAESSVDVETALAVIEKFKSIAEETQIAILTIGDRLQASVAECDDLRQQIGPKDETIVRLQSELDAAKKAVAEKTKENENLSAEVRKLRTTLDQFESLIKGVKK